MSESEGGAPAPVLGADAVSEYVAPPGYAVVAPDWDRELRRPVLLRCDRCAALVLGAGDSRPARRLARHARAPTAGEPGMTAASRTARPSCGYASRGSTCSPSPWPRSARCRWRSRRRGSRSSGCCRSPGSCTCCVPAWTPTRTGLTTHTLLGTRRLAWDDIAGLRIRRSRIGAVLRNGSTVRLPVLRPRHLSLLAAASGGRLPDPTAGATASLADPAHGRPRTRRRAAPGRPRLSSRRGRRCPAARR